MDATKKEKRRLSMRKWRASHPERDRELHSLCGKNYRERHRDKVNEAARKRYHKNPQKHNAMAKIWTERNREKFREYQKQWRKDNREKSNDYLREWRKNNPEKTKLYRKKAAEKYLSTVQGKLHSRMGKLMGNALKSQKASRKWESLVDYSIDDLRKHLEKQFKKHPGMNWDRFMAGEIHIDHKIPQTAFNYETTDDIDFKKCWALNNLQPLWALDNHRKHAKIDRPYQPSLALAI